MHPYHHASSISIPASPADVFAFVDDHTRLSSHMSKASWRMGGGHMSIDLDEGHGQTTGSRIRLRGVVFGMRVSVEEVVTERNPPRLKVWETLGQPRLLVIGPYQMGVELEALEGSTLVRVFIHYAPPSQWPWRWLGFLFGRFYARWCTRRMTQDVAQHFQRQETDR